MRHVFLIFIVLGSCSSKTLPSFIHKCSKSDPNLNSCLDKSALDAAQKLKDGSKDLGILPLEPFFIKKIDLGNVSNGAVSLHQVYENINLYGMTNATVFDSNASFTGDNCYWYYKVSEPWVRMEADYAMTGNLLIFPINGHGRCTNYLYGVEGQYGATCERYTKKNRTYFRVKDFTFEMKPKKIVFDFENVIDGNEQLSKEVVKTVNENSESVYADVAPAFNEVFATVWRQTLNQVFSRIPEDELFLP